VANSVGFKSTLTYTRCFEKLVKMTPSQYRKYY
jgi:AraC-like DNA-binding protein